MDRIRSTGKGVVCLGCRLPVTAMAVTSDDTTAFSVSKDGSIFRMDIETGAR